LIVLWLWQWGHSMTFSLALLLFSHATNSMTSAFTTDRTSIFELLRWLFTKSKPRASNIFISGDGTFAVKKLKAVYEEIEGMFLQKKQRKKSQKWNNLFINLLSI
jgi:hypothetical protein